MVFPAGLLTVTAMVPWLAWPSHCLLHASPCGEGQSHPGSQHGAVRGALGSESTSEGQLEASRLGQDRAGECTVTTGDPTNILGHSRGPRRVFWAPHSEGPG